VVASVEAALSQSKLPIVAAIELVAGWLAALAGKEFRKLTSRQLDLIEYQARHGRQHDECQSDTRATRDAVNAAIRSPVDQVVGRSDRDLPCGQTHKRTGRPIGLIEGMGGVLNGEKEKRTQAARRACELKSDRKRRMPTV
jgi:hypothetical protein